jgi:hypothetical protein
VGYLVLVFDRKVLLVGCALVNYSVGDLNRRRKEMACDICGNGGNMEELLRDYQVDSVTHVCGKCSSELNNHLWKIRKMQSGIAKTMIKRYLTNRHNDLITKQFNNKKPLI